MIAAAMLLAFAAQAQTLAPDTSGAWPQSDSAAVGSAAEQAYKMMTPRKHLAVQGIFPGEIGFELPARYPKDSGKAVIFYEITVSAAATGTPEVTTTLNVSTLNATVNAPGMLATNVSGSDPVVTQLLLFGAAAGTPNKITLKLFTSDGTGVLPENTWTETVTVPRDKMTAIALPSNPSDGLKVTQREFERPTLMSTRLDEDAHVEQAAGAEVTSIVTLLKDSRKESGGQSAVEVSVIAPVAAATGDKVELKGSVSGAGTAVAYAWAQTQGPETTIEDADKSVASFVPKLPGLYRFRFDASTSKEVISGGVEVNVTGGTGITPELISQPTMESPAADIVIYGNELIVFSKSNPEIFVYDITDPAKPERKAKYRVPIEGRFVQAELAGGTMYVLVRSGGAEKEGKTKNVRLVTIGIDGSGNMELTGEIPIGDKNARMGISGNNLFVWTPDIEKTQSVINDYDISNTSNPRLKWSEKFQKFVVTAAPMPGGRIAAAVTPEEMEVKHRAEIYMFPFRQENTIHLINAWEDVKGVNFSGSYGRKDLGGEFVVGTVSGNNELKVTAEMKDFKYTMEVFADAAGPVLAAYKAESETSANTDLRFIDISDISAPVEKTALRTPSLIDALTTDGHLIALSYRNRLLIYKMY